MHMNTLVYRIINSIGWNMVRDVRGYVTLAIEKERQNKNIRSSLEAFPILKLKQKLSFFASFQIFLWVTVESIKQKLSL